MKKFLPLVLFLFVAVFLSSCVQSLFPRNEVSSIKIILPGRNNSSREAQVMEPEDGGVIQNGAELNFIFTVSDKDGEKVSLTGKSGETLVAEVEAGTYSVSLKGYLLDDAEFTQPICEASQDKVEVIAGEVTKVVLELKLIEIVEPEPEPTGIKLLYELPSGVTDTELLYIVEITKEGKSIYASKEPESIKDFYKDLEAGIYSVTVSGYKTGETEFPLVSGILSEVEIVNRKVNEITLPLEVVATDKGGVEVIVPEITLPGTLGISVIVEVDGEILASPYFINKGSEVKASVLLPETVTIADIKWTLGDYPFEDKLEDGNSISFDSSLYGELGLQNFTVTVIDQNGKEYFAQINLIFTGDDN